MTAFFAFSVELALLFLLSRQVTRGLFSFFLLLFGSGKIAVSATTLLFFPGTVIHELSHLFTAEILGVRTGKLTLVPEAIDSQNMKTGGVAIAQTDPFRRAAIGLAPIIVGIVALSVISYFLSDLFQQYNNITILTIVLWYFLFSISNTMFSSPEDLKGFFPLLITLSLFVTAAYIAGIRVSLAGGVLQLVKDVTASLTQSLGLVLAVNMAILLTIHVLIVVTTKILRRRIIEG